MGYIKHHCIVVTSFDKEALQRARGKAILAKLPVSNIVISYINDYHSFFIAPDGSKEGWMESEEGELRRAKFIEWLKFQRYDDNSSPYDWFMASYSSDDRKVEIVEHEYEVEIGE